MTKVKEQYALKYRAQKLKFYKRKIEEFKDRLLEEPWDFKIEEAILLLKNENIEDVEIIEQARKEVMG